MKHILVPVLFLLCLVQSLHGQESLAPKDSVNRSRLNWVIGTEAVLYTGTIIGLNELWYKGYERGPMRHFNDNHEWLQMDKIGHGVTAYYVGLAGIEALRWAGVDERKSRWYGGGLGWFFLSSVEILDGYSAEWGFSSGDVISNTIGAGLLIGQDALWGEQRIVCKFSYRQSPYAAMRPSTLGDGFNEEVLKDYNGQTYWVSANIHSFLGEESQFPKWLSLGAGYGVDGLLQASGDYTIVSPDYSQTFSGARQYYLGLDVDLWRIPTKRKGLRLFLKTIGFIRLPLPAFMFQDGKMKVQGFRF